MIAFWILAAVLAALAAAALLPALLRRPRSVADSGDEAVIGVFRERLAELEREHERGNLSDDDFAEAKTDLERELLADYTPGQEPAAAAAGPGSRTSAAALAVLVPVAALLLYAATGAPDIMSSSMAEQLGPEEVQRYRAMEPERRIDALEPIVAEHPRAPWGWRLLGGAYYELERYRDAVTAYGRARESGADNDAWLIARQAEALLLANDRRFGGDVQRLIDEALARDARNPLALMLAGHAAFVEGDREGAASYWQRLVDTMPPGDNRRALIEDLIARARGTDGGQARAGDEQGAEAAGAQDSADARVTARVRLAQALRERAGPDDTVFVFARNAGAGGPPLAVVRTTVGALPAEISLTDADAMSPQAQLSGAQEVVVTARVSLSGDVMAQSGDLEGRSERVAVNGGSTVDVVIDRRIE